MKIFLSIAAILAWLIGAALLLVPAGFYAPTGIHLTPLLATIAQAHGATLVGLGVVNWFARTAQGQGLKAILSGNVVVQVLSFLVALNTYFQVGNGVVPALVIHTVLGSLFIFFLLKNWHQFKSTFQGKGV